MREVDAAYIAGLFDGEGCVSYKQYMRKRSHNKKAYPTWQIRLEIAMTDRSILVWLNEILGVGTVGEKKYKSRYALGWKKQWRWRCSCLLYTSDAADDMQCVDLGGRRIIKKKK